MPTITYEARYRDSGATAGFNQLGEAIDDTAASGKKVETAAGLMQTAISVAAGIGIAQLAELALKGFGELSRAALDAAVEIDAAFDKIRVTTGATGDDLAGLQTNFKNVFGNVASNASDVSTAMADLHSKLGLMDGTLERVGTQFLNLSRITGTNLKTNIDAVSAAFKNWGIEADDQEEKLDLLFKTSQSTGLGVDKLATAVRSNGAALQAMGFSFDEATVLMGRFEKAGIESTEASQALKRALVDMSKDGITDARAGFDELIKRIRDATTETEAVQIAAETFGTRGAVQMAKAIRDGSFELDKMLNLLRESPETINKAAAATDDFGENWQKVKNNVTLALTPLGNTMMAALGDLTGALLGLVTGLNDASAEFGNFARMAGGAQAAAERFATELKDKFGIEISKSGESFETWTNRMVEARAQIDQLKKQAREGGLSFEGFNGFVEKSAEATRLSAEETKKLAAEAKKMQAELAKLKTTFEDALNPTTKLVAEMEKLRKLGEKEAEVVAVYGDKLIKATVTASEHGQAISDLGLGYAELAVAQRRAADAAKPLRDALESMKNPLTDARKLFEGYELAIDETGQAYFRLTTLFKDAPNPSLQGLIITPAEMERNRKVMAGLEKAPRQVRDVWSREISTITNDWIKGIADIIVEGGNLKDKMVGIAKETGKGMLRAFLDELLSPLKKQLLEFGHWLGDKLKGWLGIGGGSTSIPTGGSTGGTGGVGGTVGTISTKTKLTEIAGVGAGALGSWGIGKLSGGGVAGAISSAAGGILAGFGLTALLNPALLPAFLAAGPAGWLALAGIAAVGPLINLANGKTAYQAGAMEVGRDFGGIKTSTKDFKSWLNTMGITESQAYPIRKDLTSSPKYLAEVAGPLAKEQGKLDSFLASLEHVSTAWGTFDFRKAFEIGDATGDWSELDKAFSAAFSSSKALADGIPGWKDLLLKGGDAAKQVTTDFQDLWKEFRDGGKFSQEFADFLADNANALDEMAASSAALSDELDDARAAMKKFDELSPIITGFGDLKTALEGLKPAAGDIYKVFFDTGEILPELRQQIEDYGGDLARFEEVARLAQLDSEFADLAATFRETHVATERLREVFREFGGDLATLDKAADLSALDDALESIADFRDELDKIVPEKTGLEKVLEGIYDEAALVAEGLDPAKFRGIADLIKARTDWDKAVADFDKTGKLVKGGALERDLLDYGGAKGQLAVDRYGQGFNTITRALLADTKAAMDRDFSAEKKKLIGYLDEIETATKSKRDRIIDDIEAQFGIVSRKIADLFEDARKLAIVEIDLIIDRLNEAVALAATLPRAESYLPPPPAETAPAQVTINTTFTGDISGVDDLEESVGRAISRTVERGGLRGYVTRRTR